MTYFRSGLTLIFARREAKRESALPDHSIELPAPRQRMDSASFEWSGRPKAVHRKDSPNKNAHPRVGSGRFHLGRLAVTYFRAIYLALSSALKRFTVLFGMGRRGSTSLWPPSKAGSATSRRSRGIKIAANKGSCLALMHKAIGSSRTGN